MSFLKKLLLINAGAITPLTVLGCACGCGLLNPGSDAMMPRSDGGIVYLQDDWQQQDHNRAGDDLANAADNGDKSIRTNTTTAGIRYMFNWNWGVQVDMPYVYRSFSTDDNFGNPDRPMS